MLMSHVCHILMFLVRMQQLKFEVEKMSGNVHSLYHTLRKIKEFDPARQSWMRLLWQPHCCNMSTRSAAVSFSQSVNPFRVEKSIPPIFHVHMGSICQGHQMLSHDKCAFKRRYSWIICHGTCVEQSPSSLFLSLTLSQVRMLKCQATGSLPPCFAFYPFGEYWPQPQVIHNTADASWWDVFFY